MPKAKQNQRLALGIARSAFVIIRLHDYFNGAHVLFGGIIIRN
jgi:hypothetical protein